MKFQGKYIQDLGELYVASIISGIHSVAIGAPGWGKTDVAEATARQIVQDRWAMVRLHPATTPSEVEGPLDISALVNEGVQRRIVDGGAYDPANMAVIVDEIGRANAAVVGALLFLLDRRDIPHPAPVLATSNFMPTDVAAQALLDRIGLWLHLPEQQVADVRSMVSAQLQATNGRLQLDVDMPSGPDEVREIWEATPGPQAVEAIADVLEQIAADAAAEGFHVNPRRLFQWQRVLFRVGVWKSGSADFQTVPDQAIRALRFAWPAMTPEDGQRWASVVAASGDPVGLVIDEVLAEVARAMNEKIADMEPGNADAILELAQIAQRGQKRLADLGSDDPRVEEARREMNAWIGKAANGQSIQRM